LMLCLSTFSITERQKIPIDPKCFRSTANEIIWYIYIYVGVKKKEEKFEHFFFVIKSFPFLSSTDVTYMYIYIRMKKKQKG
jgi:hypothetical protein